MVLYGDIQASGVSDPVFHRARFHRCPVALLRGQLAAIELKAQQTANAHSFTMARHAWFTAGSKELKESDFLPYPHLERSVDACKPGLTPSEGGRYADVSSVSRETCKLFLAGVRSGFIPDRVISAFGHLMPEIQRFSS